MASSHATFLSRHLGPLVARHRDVEASDPSEKSLNVGQNRKWHFEHSEPHHDINVELSYSCKDNAEPLHCISLVWGIFVVNRLGTAMLQD
jgi:hypothetical protein